MPDLPLFPESASSLSAEVDALYLAWVGISLFFSVLIAIIILVFFVKYRRRDKPVGEALKISTLPIEITWSVIPLVIVLVMFAWGAKVFFDLSTPPEDAVDYYAVGKQWMWKFQHPQGVREINDLHVPVNQPVRITMTSQDVIHSLYLPAFRVKADVIPGRYTTVWFKPTKPGAYHLFCAEYCGTEHSKMGGTIYVMEQAQYDAWLARGGVGAPTMQASGAALFEQLACNTCHRVGDEPMPDGLPNRAPDLEHIFGTEVALQNGRTAKVDEGYIRESILNPRAKIVEGWQPIMPTYQGQVTEEQLNELVHYIKTLGQPEEGDGINPPAAPAEGSEVAAVDPGRAPLADPQAEAVRVAGGPESDATTRDAVSRDVTIEGAER